MSADFKGDRMRVTVDFKRPGGMMGLNVSDVETAIAIALVTAGQNIPVLITKTQLQNLEVTKLDHKECK